MNGRHAILVTGATGTTGRPLVDLLVGEGAEVRDVTRTPRAAGLPAHVEVVEGDPVRPETIAPSLAGATAVFFHPPATGLAAGGRSIRLPTAPRNQTNRRARGSDGAKECLPAVPIRRPSGLLPPTGDHAGHEGSAPHGECLS
jgi:uncharacterized protein YbjT (DUF2867 family)